MNKNINFELLLAKDCGTYYNIIGITYSNAMVIEPDCATLRATLFAIEECKKALSNGKTITISKEHTYSEIQPYELVINEIDELERHKLMAINEVSAKLHQALFSISVIDLMEYLNNYIILLNAGYYVTDSNREEKYFEIIEDSQKYEEPAPLSENSSFIEEQEYIENKRKYETAQNNLATLENYLNSYDKLSKIQHIAYFLTHTRERINEAKTLEELDATMKTFRSNVQNYKLLK